MRQFPYTAAIKADRLQNNKDSIVRFLRCLNRHFVVIHIYSFRQCNLQLYEKHYYNLLHNHIQIMSS